MVRKFEKPFRSGVKNNIRADVIILGCSLPGIVTAHKLKKRFGDTMDIVVLDLATPSKNMSKGNVAFQEDADQELEEEEDSAEDQTPKQVIDNVARHYLYKYAKDFNIPLPDPIIAPQKVTSPLSKLFQYRNGSTVECTKNYHDFDYLSFMEKFELNQYQSLLDQSMRNLFHTVITPSETRRMLYYDQTTMEKHICDALLFSTPREIMRTTVRLVCGATSENVSVLFYLHQCYRTSSSKNHLDGDNTRFREKLLGYCRKHLASKLQQSIADITMTVKPIKEIRTYPDEKVILETRKGGTNYICNLLAMALRPDELHNIQVETQLLSDKEAEITNTMVPGKAKKFVIQYDENFWQRDGYSGDILSVRGPIIWAMERPKMSSTGSMERYSALIGYLKVRNDSTDSMDAVIEQLIKLFGAEAASPVSYRETIISDVYIPRCGDYVAIRRLTCEDSPKYLEWGALDIFADGDVAGAIEAGHIAYLHLLSCLRPQAQTYDDLCMAEWSTSLNEYALNGWLVRASLSISIRFVALTAALAVGVHLIKSYMRK